MTLNLKMVPTEKCDYPSQPRSNPDLDYCRRLGANMKAIGQKVPVIGNTDPVTGVFNVIDGGCRLIGAREEGIPELLALDLGKAPTLPELLMAQAAIDLYRQHLRAIDRARLWQANMKERVCTARKLAKELGVDESLVGDFLSLLRLPSDVQEQVNSGVLHMSKASMIAQQESNPDRQRELAALAPDIPRSKLAARIKRMQRGGQQEEVRVNSLRCPLPTGTTVVLKGRELTLDDAIQALTELLRAMKKASEDGIDGSTFSRICRDKAKTR
jgi:ParB family transcriptional regulator, chromosome partitioning protein